MDRENALALLRPQNAEGFLGLKEATEERLENCCRIVGDEWCQNNLTFVPFQLPSLLRHNRIKNAVVYSVLNADQRVVFQNFHEEISASYDPADQNSIVNPKILLLDTPSGTGKLFLLKLLSMTFKGTMWSIVYSRAIEEEINSYSNIRNYTLSRFLVRIGNTSFEEAMNMFNPIYNNSDYLLIANKYWNEAILSKWEIDSVKAEVFILYQYTRFSPWFIYFLIVYCYAKRINLLFVGDKNQLNAIDRSDYHKANNHTLIWDIVDKKLVLSQQMRMGTGNLDYLSENIRKPLSTLRDLRPMSFKHAYLIYQIFPEKFFLPENWSDNLFLAQFHEKLTNRTLRLLGHLNQTPNQDSKIVPFIFQTTNETFNRSTESSKFLGFLLLVPNHLYFYVDKNQGYRKTVVRYESIDENGLLNLRNEEDGTTFKLGKVDISKEYFLDKYVDWLKAPYRSRYNEIVILQYPLLPYCSTYHAVPGLRISHDWDIEMDIDVKSTNCIYVGLTRINNADRLKKIHSKLLPSLILTRYFNDNYYYKINQNHHEDFCNRLVEETKKYYENNVPGDIVYPADLCLYPLQFKIVNDISTFEDESSDMCRIERCLFVEETQESNDFETTLMNLCKFAQDTLKNDPTAAQIYNYEIFKTMYEQWKSEDTEENMQLST